MKTMITLIGIAVVAQALAQEPLTNLHLQVAERRGEVGDRPAFYSEVLRDGTNFVVSTMRRGMATDITFWFDRNHAFTISDTNGDGRSDQFCVSADGIPQSAWLRNTTNGLVRVDAQTLSNAQEFYRFLASDFPKVVDAAKKGATNDFRVGLSNLIQKAIENRSQQSAAPLPSAPRTGPSEGAR